MNWEWVRAAIRGASIKNCLAIECLNDIVLVDQAPIGRTPRSNPSPTSRPSIRSANSSPPSPKRSAAGYTAGHFSFNVPGGRCDTCEGDGTVTVEMQFLADVELPCEECNGTRYQASILEVQYKGKNIHEVLQMTVKEALRFFAGQTRSSLKNSRSSKKSASAISASASPPPRSPAARRSASSSPRISPRSAPPTPPPCPPQASRVLYILDEPTTGLHFDDVSKLLTAFRKLIDGGGSLIVIEHNLDVIKSADWVIDLGPEGGDAGGRIVCQGTPEQIAANLHSHTGQWLARALAPRTPPKEVVV